MLKHGAKSLTDAELLAILIGSGSQEASAVDLGREILKVAKQSLFALARFSVKDLCKIKGIGEAKAIAIMAAFELVGRKTQEKIEKRTKVSSSKDAYEYFKHQLEDKNYEEFWVLLLNRANRIIESKQISEGGVSGTVADPKKIFKTALEQTASGLILCHNHPSGNLNPSRADIQLTKKIKEGAKQLDIALLDHLIIAQTGYYSFADEGYI